MGVELGQILIELHLPPLKGPVRRNPLLLFSFMCKQITQQMFEGELTVGLWTQRDGFGLLCLEISLLFCSPQRNHIMAFSSLCDHQVYLNTSFPILSVLSDCLIHPFHRSLMVLVTAAHNSLDPLKQLRRWLTKQGLLLGSQAAWHLSEREKRIEQIKQRHTGCHSG